MGTPVPKFGVVDYRYLRALDIHLEHIYKGVIQVAHMIVGNVRASLE